MKQFGISPVAVGVYFGMTGLRDHACLSYSVALGTTTGIFKFNTFYIPFI